ncbi:MAG TPA: O-antigen ligase family protein, partial [Gemmataceae bacterium]|nr:O-antigen ligase family protein [Gemmataceae bacterium]
YEIVILSCMAFSWKPLLEQLQGRSLARQPITVCILGLWVAVALSHLSHANPGATWTAAKDFGKVVVYYLLLVSLVNNPSRLRQFLYALVLYTGTMTVLALLQYHGAIDVEALATLKENGSFNESTGEQVIFLRLRGPGIFNDPNDLCLILLTGMAICLWRAADRNAGIRRLGWIGLIGLFGYALSLTQSRGGFIALAAMCLVLFWTRFGWRRALVLGLLVLPPLLFVFGERQTSLSASSGTGQDRIRLWSFALNCLREAPLFGIGAGQFEEREGLVAHNSYIHGFAELGFIGGTLFLGAFYCAISGLFRIRDWRLASLAPELDRVRPYLIAIVVGYGTGILALTRDYTVTTYLPLGLATVFVDVGAASVLVAPERVSLRLIGRLAAIGCAFVIIMYVVVRSLAVWH